ncbi:MAG TPA: cell division protein FtsQ/DivIB [Gaiellaceae bacterium]|nr:cell division protein FtsQ/DivIB [Gaiellaceae bacterium]
MPEIGMLVPTGRSLLVALAILLAAGGAYAVARETSIFAVRILDVRGGTPAIRAQARAAIGGDVGKSLLRVGGADLADRLSTVTGVRSFRFDRRFPNTLEVVITAERPVLIIRQGKTAFLVSSTGRVLRSLGNPRLSSLPRLWLPTKADAPLVGKPLPAAEAAAAIAVGPLRSATLPGHVEAVTSNATQLTLTLASGFQVRLGDVGDLHLKLSIARRILRMTGVTAGAGYVDVSVPERPVLSTNSQVGG